MVLHGWSRGGDSLLNFSVNSDRRIGYRDFHYDLIVWHPFHFLTDLIVSGTEFLVMVYECIQAAG